MITTKVVVPHLRDGLVARKELVERLKAGLTRPLTLVSAPAGYGKTTLLVELATQIPVAWLSLDEEDNDPVRFWGHFTAALQTRVSYLSGDLQRILMSSGLPSTRALLIQLIDEISRGEPPVQPYVIVLDDYHLIEEKNIHKDLAFFLEHLPHQVRLIISTRVDPPLPLAKMRAQGQLKEIRAQDLRFNLEEIDDILNTIAGLGLSDQDIKALEARTEGWVAGLQMAAISMQKCRDVSAFIRDFTGTHRYVLDYLMEEVLNQQTESVRSFLIETSLLGHLSGPLCDAVTGRQDGQEMLEQLEAANLFLVPLDNERRWFRYHHLFASLLLNRLQHPNLDHVNELNKRAAKWLRQNGYQEEAISYALASADFELTAQLLESVIEKYLLNSEVYTLLNRFARLPQKTILKHPRLAISYASAYSYMGKIEAAETWLKKVEGITLSTSEETRASIVRAHIAITQRDDGRAEENLKKVVEKKIDVNEMSQLELTSIVFDAIYAGYLLSYLYKAHGHLHLAIRTSQYVLSTLGNIQLAVPFGALLAFPHMALAVFLYEQNDLENAFHHIKTGLAIIDQNQEKTFQVTGLAILDLIRQAITKSPAAKDYHDLESIIREDERENMAKSVYYPTILLPFLVRTHFARGNFNAVSQCMQNFERIADLDQWRVGGATWPTENIDIALAYAQLAEGKFKEAAELLEKLQDKSEIAGRYGNLIEFLLLRALALQAEGDTGQAVNLVAKAVTIAEPEGYIRIFVDLGASLAALLKEVASRNVSQPYVHRLLAEFENVKPNRPVLANRLVEPLTSRELEILKLLAGGLSNQEIAQKLVVSTGTVKTHTHHIYAKLDVRTRMQAIKRATSLNLV